MLSLCFRTARRAPNVVRHFSAADTIYALSTPPGRSGIAVIRVSGPEAPTLLRPFSLGGLLKNAESLPVPFVASPRSLRSPAGLLLDLGVVIHFPAPRSSTGEDVVELHLHGGRAVVKSVCDTLSRLHGYRLARPGEFSKRAFTNGKLDMTAVEGLSDLLNADTEVQRRQALLQLGGGLARLADSWRSILLRALAHVEAHIDFNEDEADCGERIYAGAETTLRKLLEELRLHLSLSRRGEIVREGVRMSILGPPNSGKSTLLNTIAQRKVAIVSDIAGTTRDVIDVHLDLAGVRTCICDTAGVRDHDAARDAVEVEGIQRGLERGKEAHALILLFDASSEEWPPRVPQELLQFFLSRGGGGSSGGDSSSTRNNEAAAVSLNAKSPPHTHSPFVLVVLNKLDAAKKHKGSQELATLAPILLASLKAQARALMESTTASADDLRDLHISGHEISCATGEGVKELMDHVTKVAEIVATGGGRPQGTEAAVDVPLLSRDRHKEHVQHCCDAIERFLLRPHAKMDLAAEDLRTAANAIGAMTGAVQVEELLDIIFTEFCIGK